MLNSTKGSTSLSASLQRKSSLRDAEGCGRQFVVLGGVGAIGRVVVRDLFESHPRNRILIADFNEKGAREYAKSFCSRRVSGGFADASKPAALAKLLRGHAVVINCTQHDFNVHVMRAALKAGVHYVDLGGLFHWTRRQLRLGSEFQRAGLTAILGMGCAPGITNVMARAAIERLGGRARSVKIRVGSIDFNPAPGFPYSAQTIIEELTLTPWIVTGGKFRQVKPRTGWERVKFPKPVGPQWLVRTRHSEVATLPVTFKLRQCDFKVGFDRQFVRDVVAGKIARQPADRGRPDDYEIARVIVDDKLVYDCHARAKPKWHASAGDIDTGCPPSIVAQMIVSGQITQRGVLPPEVAVPVEPFFRQLMKRGMRIEVRR
jgi:saccharopine dehydrogenase-like NADP-dependent oxidoreductase